MSLNAWERQALDSIKDGLAGSDLAALLSAFTRLESDEDMPDRENIQAGPRWALRRLRRARRRATWRRVCRRLGIQRAAMLLWLLTTAALIAVALALNNGGDHAPCVGWAGVACTATPAPEHGSGPAHAAISGQAPEQRAAGTQQAGPKAPPG